MITISPTIPQQWQGFCQLAVAPFNFLLPLQLRILELAWTSDLIYVTILKRIFTMLPAIGVVVGLWCTLLTCYTLLFRNNRLQLVGTLLVLWWDVARSVWLFWAGMGKFLIVAAGTIVGVMRVLVAILMEL